MEDTVCAVAGGFEVSATPGEGISAAEQTRAAQIGAIFFRHRSWLPIFFLAIVLFAPGKTSPLHWLLGGALVVIGEAYRMSGVAAAGTETRRRSREVQRLVKYGVFSWSRNPLYNGNFLIWMGFVVISGVLWFLPIAILLFAVEYSFIVRYEEGVLESIFGEEYLAYKGRTPRWMPRLSSSAPAVDDGYHWGEAWRSEISTFLQYAVLTIAFIIKSRYTGS
jgi:protein-S-isoprenylcysteine O-methyltransferase Ste14